MNQLKQAFVCSIVCFLAGCATDSTSTAPWHIDSQSQWIEALEDQSDISIESGTVSATSETATVKSKTKRFETKRRATSVTITQSPVWHNWEPIDNLGPDNLGDVPVLLTMGPNNYWMFGRYSGRRPNRFNAQPASLDGFDIPLMSTPYPNQFDAPGGRKPGLGGYHAWQSRDMVNWVHHGAVTERFSKWVTSAEYADGKVYIYYDFPNDQDPHLYIDADLTDGVPGKNMGLALNDPSHGSDCAVIRDADGRFHIIYEDWSPIHAQSRSWDSPLAGHAVSENGIDEFKILSPAVDERTAPIGIIKTYKHPHWTKEDPERFQSDIAEYEVHEPNQECYGDWAAICIGGRYYLFADYDPEHGKPMSVAWFTADSMDDQFTKIGSIGQGHPDPDICFAEGKFYLATQQKTDYISPGPWVESIEVRIGVDTNNDGAINQWTNWQQVKESYDYIPGFSKQIAKSPATMDLSALPEGYGFKIELKITDTTDNPSKPIIDKLTMRFQ